MGINCILYVQNSELDCSHQTQCKVFIKYTNKNLKVSYLLFSYSYRLSVQSLHYKPKTRVKNFSIKPVTRILRVQKLIIQTNIWLLSGSMSNLLSVRGTYWKLSDGPAECETLSCVLINIKTAEKGSRRFTSLQARLCTLRAKLDNNGT